jgi:murein DD-endopeptidase MepM/ murein hydrolase activator NlpD
MIRLIGIGLVMTLMTIQISAGELVPIDDLHFQEYRGRLGIWAPVESQAKMNYYIKKFYITMKDIQAFNGNFKYRTYLFIPYSENYIQELEAQGIRREMVATKKSDFIWPLSQVNNISSTFGQRYGRFHTGTDMPATRGTPIVAVMDGRVLSTRYDGGFGRTITMEHRDNFFTRYAHCDVILVKDGDFIRKGQLIGLVGSTGTSTGNHLHFEIRYNDIPLNPLDFLPYKENLRHMHKFRNWN